ncbi:MAG: carboxylesterase family protein [Clostridia bacterium]|nr:carboxylesterase family protein [Clostridia bacterium]
MKKLYTIDDFMIPFVSAIGYGYGETIAMLSGWSPIACLVACFALGIFLEELITKIIFSAPVQKKTINRVMVYAAAIIFFAVAHYISAKWMGKSMIEYLMEEYMYVIGLPILGFIVNTLLRRYRVRKVRELYGDGSKGYVFDLDKEDIDELSGQNKSVRGDYDDDLAIKTRTGIYIGEKQGTTLFYLGIPYAKPPVGELRWKAPQPLPSSEAVFEADNPGASPIQVEHKGTILKHHRQSEDCLTLNIFASTKKTEQKKSVLVLFNHGDFTYGGSIDPLLHGSEFTDEHTDVILVSFNYRLGIFGFIDFSEIPGGEAYLDAPNLGLLDQIAALEWIKENIAAFGGDPDRVTVMGFEAGAASICMLAAADRAKGLFNKAFVFYGSPNSAYFTPEMPRAVARELLKETQTTTMEELIQLKTEALKDAAQRLWKNMPAPMCDGKLIPNDVYRAYKEGVAAGIEFIIGIPKNERQIFRSVIGDRKYESLVSISLSDIQNELDESGKKTLQDYIDRQTSSMTEFEAKAMLVELWHSLNSYRTAENLSEGGCKVHLMYWDEKPLIEKLGSGSVNVAAVLLGNNDASQMYGYVMNTDISEVLQSFLYKFISGEELKLYHNEIVGVDELEWKAFPNELIVSDDKIICDIIEDKLTDIKDILDFIAK